MKSVCIRSYSCPYFPAFGLNTERYFVCICIQSEFGKMRTRITPNTNTFYNHQRLSMNVSWYPLNGLINNKISKKLLITCSNQFSSYLEVYSERYKRSKMEPFTKIVVSQKSQHIWQGFETPFSILMWVLQ